MPKPGQGIPVSRSLWNRSNAIAFAGFLILSLVGLTRVAAAAPTVTGQWDFKYGDLRATIGADLQYTGTTSNITTFPTLSLNGQNTRVMAFGSNNTNQGFYMRHGAQPNGGGHFVNQYTLIMDVMYPTGSTGQWRALFQTDPFNDPGNDAEFYIGNGSTSPSPGGIGANGQFDGTIAANTWYRIAFVVDLTAAPGNQLTKYVNGVLAGRQSLPGGIDGQYALGPTALLFTSGLSGNFTQPGYVSSIQFLNSPISASDIALLGGPKTNGIAPAAPLIQTSAMNWQTPSFKISWNGRKTPAPQLQISATLNPAGWFNVGSLDAEGKVIIPVQSLAGISLFFRVAASQPATIEPNVPVETEAAVGATSSGYYLPTKQWLHTPGKTIQYHGAQARPLDMLLSPDGKTLYVKSGDAFTVVDVPSWTLVEQTNYPAEDPSVHGMAATADGAHVYTTSAFSQLYDWVTNGQGTVSIARTINLLPSSNPCGIALSADGTTAYVCLGIYNALGVVNLASGTLTSLINLGIAPYAVALSPDGKTAYVSDWGGRIPTGGDLIGYSVGIPVVVDSRGIASSGVLSIVNLTTKQELLEVPTGLHPADVKLSADGKTLYVANANSDTVTVINTQTRTVQETILVRPDPTLPVGSAGGALALSPDGGTLYVANGNNNAIAVVQLPNGQHTNSLVQGFIPTDWYPSAVVADSSNIYVANLNGVPGLLFSAYFLPTLNKIPIPSTDTLSKYTAEVRENGRIPQILRTQVAPLTNQAPVPVPAHVGEPSVFKHVFYVIKENKTYDQVLGDIPRGNGNPDICIYPQTNTPNHHALATQFVLLDNFYCNGVQSFDGHAWSTEGNNSDYLQRGYNSYPRGANQGNDPLYYSSSGFIWNDVLQHGLTFTNFGELGSSFPEPSSITWSQVWSDYTNHAGKLGYNTYIGNPPLLPAYSSTNVSGFNLGIADQLRAETFLTAFRAASNGVWPALTILYLPGDHTAGASPGFPTPAAQVADNDLALGREVEAISKSAIWSNSVIFVIEDDPLGGYDHVDAHRSLCLVISPYTKRGQTVSAFYNQVGVLHTMEQILGLPPMNQMDAMSPLMTDCFVNQPDFSSYTALPSNIPLDTMNPGTTAALKMKDRYWARASLKLDFSKPDMADEKILSRIIWHSIRGNERYPSEFVGGHGKGLKKLGLFAVKTDKDDDD